jgi:hypothetical protein
MWLGRRPPSVNGRRQTATPARTVHRHGLAYRDMLIQCFGGTILAS